MFLYENIVRTLEEIYRMEQKFISFNSHNTSIGISVSNLVMVTVVSAAGVLCDRLPASLLLLLFNSEGEFQALQLTVLTELLSWINHLPPVCWSTFWKSTFKEQLGCRFDIMDCKSSFFCILTYAIGYVLIHYIFFFDFIFTSSIVLFIFIWHSCTNGFHRGNLYTFY